MRRVMTWAMVAARPRVPRIALYAVTAIGLSFFAAPEGHRPRADTGAAAPWPMFRHDAAHTGRSAFLGARRGSVKWSRELYPWEDYPASSPAVDSDGTVYIGSEEGGFMAIRPSGVVKWSIDLVGDSAAIGSDGIIYFGAWGWERSLYSFNIPGNLRWFAPINVGSFVTIDDQSNLYTASYDSKEVISVRPDGVERWRFALPRSLHFNPPAVSSDGTAYLGARDGTLYAIRSDGSLKWTRKLRGRIYGSCAVRSDGCVITGTGAANLYCVTPAGKVKWTFRGGGSFNYSDPALGDDDTVYIGTSAGQLHAVSASGSERWTIQTGSTVLSPSVDGAGTVYVSSGGCIYAVSSSGAVKWKSDLGYNSYFDIAVGTGCSLYCNLEYEMVVGVE